MATRDPREPFIRIEVDEARDMMRNGDVQLIDVREPHEFAGGRIGGAHLIPVMSLFGRTAELDRERKIIFVCQVGQRSALACEMAAAAGFDPERLFNLEGGTEAWVKRGLPLER